jgi:hypothetical protein
MDDSVDSSATTPSSVVASSSASAVHMTMSQIALNVDERFVLLRVKRQLQSSQPPVAVDSF